MDGANSSRSFTYLTIPHLARPVAVVVMIEMIFLLSIFAEIAITINGRPGNASINLTCLIFKQSLMNFDVGVALAGALFAIVLANIVAIFLICITGKNLDRGSAIMDANPLYTTIRALFVWGIALLLFFPLGWLFLTSFMTELQAIAVPPPDFFGTVARTSVVLVAVMTLWSCRFAFLVSTRLQHDVHAVVRDFDAVLGQQSR